MFSYQQQVDFGTRKTEVDRIKAKWPGKIPIILEKDSRSEIKTLSKSKFLCPDDYTLQQFQACIRKKIHLPQHVSLYFFVNGKTLPASESSVSQIYQDSASEDGFLYILYSELETKG